MAVPVEEELSRISTSRIQTGSNSYFLILFLLSFLLVLIFPSKTLATDSNNQFITIVNPVRISKYTKDIKRNVEVQYEQTQKRNLPATWLVTFDVLERSDVTTLLTNMDSSHELGIFLEVSPDFASKAGVEYNKTDSWHRAHALFLSGYTQEDRKKLIDTLFEKFKQIFKIYPKSVGAWWIDSYSLEYMKEKYNIIANLGLADQFATDGYQVWGQYWSTPFIPGKYHAGIPANSPNNKLDLVTIEWAPRDPLNGYGTNPANNYSTQDYFTINLTDDYFSKLLDLYSSKNLNQFGHITIGLETDLDPSAYQDIYARWLDIAKTKDVTFLTMSNFAKWYLNKFEITPAQMIVTDDLLGTKRKAIWYQSPFYRIAINSDEEGNSRVVDFRIYPENFAEPNYLSPNRQLTLFINLPSIIDRASNSDLSWIISENKLTDVGKGGDDLILRFGNQEMKLSEMSISLQNLNHPPEYLMESPLLNISSNPPNITLIPKTKYVIPQSGYIFRGLSIEARYFLNRPKVKLLTNTLILLATLTLYLFFRTKIHKKVKPAVVGLVIGIVSIGGFTLYFLNSQLFEVGQSEVDALLHLAALPVGKVVVYDDGCLICPWHTKYPPPFFANNRSYIQSISKKPIVYNLKIFTTESRSDGRKELKKTGAKYIYVTKFEDYQETLPFSPGDYYIDMIYENANAQIWKVRDNAPL